jgi:malonyl-CoA/methylmalonyl-CoA synthetase
VSGTLPAAWIERWAVDPDRRVLWDGARGWVTAAELEEASRRVAGRLQGAGLEPGDRVLFSAGPSIDLVAAHVGALRAGLVTVPVNTAYTEREVAHVVGDARPRAAVVDDLARLAEA